MTSINDRRDFRKLSRLIKQHPDIEKLHKQRLTIALRFSEGEAVQGALADYFYGCWYNVPFFADAILTKTQSKLRPNVFKAFQSLNDGNNYLFKVNTLATGWSVLTTPSLEVSSYRIKTSTDYSMSKVTQVVESLMLAKSSAESRRITAIENDFFAYCLACEDNLAFMKAWLQLSKLGWVFHDSWEETRNKMN